MNTTYHISYDKLWKLLIDKHMMKKDLQKASSLSSNVITKMGKGESVTLETLAKICIALRSFRYCGNPFERGMRIGEFYEEGNQRNLYFHA